MCTSNNIAQNTYKIKHESQVDRIYDYMLVNGSISSLEAFEGLHIMRLASRIHDLRMRGIQIDVTMHSYKKKDGARVSYAVYSLHKEADDEQTD